MPWPTWPGNLKMTILIAACTGLLVLTTVVHYEALRLFSVELPRLPVPLRKRLIGMVLGGFAAHMLQIALCALAILAQVRRAGLSTLGGSANPGWATAMYFSAETFTSLGYGDGLPDGPLRLLAGVEALNGWLLIG